MSKGVFLKIRNIWFSTIENQCGKLKRGPKTLWKTNLHFLKAGWMFSCEFSCESDISTYNENILLGINSDSNKFEEKISLFKLSLINVCVLVSDKYLLSYPNLSECIYTKYNKV